MEKEVLDKILELAQPKIIELNGLNYSSKEIKAVRLPQPQPLQVHTLDAVLDYLKENPDDLPQDNLIVHIQGPEQVNVYSKILEESHAQRDLYLSDLVERKKFPFGAYHDLESFIIQLQTSFVPDETTANMMKLLGNIQDGKIANFSDDGITQQATVKVGITRVENVAVPNPVLLSPYRTFLEIEQPASKFIFRLRSGAADRPPACALFEAGGGNWQLEAISNIKEYLEDDLPEGITLLA